MKKYGLLTILFLLCLGVFSQSKSKKKDKSSNTITNKEITQVLKSQDPFQIQILGNGNIQKSFESGEDIPANTGVGVSVQKYFIEYDSINKEFEIEPFFGFYKLELDININIASTADTLNAKLVNNEVSNKSDFGSSLLTPLNSGEAATIDARLYFKETYCGVLSGVFAKYIGSNRIWNYQDSSLSFAKQASIGLVRIGAFHDFVTLEQREDYSIRAGIAFAVNSLKGDLGLSRNESERMAILESTRTLFFGGEFSLVLRLKNVSAGFAYSFFPKCLNDQAEIPGFSGSRLITTIGFTGGFNLAIK